MVGGGPTTFFFFSDGMDIHTQHQWGGGVPCYLFRLGFRPGLKNLDRVPGPDLGRSKNWTGTIPGRVPGSLNRGERSPVEAKKGPRALVNLGGTQVSRYPRVTNVDRDGSGSVRSGYPPPGTRLSFIRGKP